MTKNTKIWVVTVIAAAASYCTIAFGLPLLFETVPAYVNAEDPEAVAKYYEDTRKSFHFSGMCAAGLTLVQPILAKLTSKLSN